MTINELKTTVITIDAKLTEASGELTKLIADLRAALESVEVPAEVVTTLAAIEAKATALADIVQ